MIHRRFTHMCERGAKVGAARATAWWVALLLAGCSSVTPPSTLLTLPPSLAAVGAPDTKTTEDVARVLVVRRVEVPEYLQSRRVRFRNGASTLAEWPHVYWAERIDVGASQRLVASLRQALPGWTICEADCPSGPEQRLLRVELAPFDYLRDSAEVVGEARITISAGTTATQALRTGRYRYTVPVKADTPEGQAQAMADLLHRVGHDAAADVKASHGAAR